MSTKKCMNPACVAQVSGGYLTCRDCWGHLPQTIQQKVCERLYGWTDVGAAREFLSLHYKYKAAQAKLQAKEAGESAA